MYSRKTGIIIIILASGSSLFAQDGTPLMIGTNYRIHPGSVSQTETFLARNPADPNTFFATCNTLNFIPFFISEGIYVTNDAGLTWRGNDTCTGYPVGYHGGDPGITIDKNGTFILTRLGRSPFVGLYSHYSADQGMNWSNQLVISTDDLERASLASDIDPGSPFYGRSYAAWVTFASPFPVKFSFTLNGGQSWSTPLQVNNPPNRSAGGDIAIGPGGKLYICWAGVTDVSPFREILVGFARSADGGASWNVTENAFPVNGITGVLPGKSNIRVNGLPSIAVDTSNSPRKGWIYIVTTQKNLAPAGSEPDIILYRSSDDGATWSQGIRVNRDPLNNGKTQYFPAIHIDRFGAVDILFYDDRTTTNDSASVFLARSKDGGDTWSEYEISDHHFKPVPIGGLGQGYQGDNIDLSSTDTKLIPVWMDNSSGIYQLWTTPVYFSDINAVVEDPNPVIVLYPNPTTGIYDLRFTGDDWKFAEIDLLNIYGKYIEKLFIGTVGSETIRFDVSSLQAGIYFCRIRAGNQVMVRKLIKTD